VGRSYGRWLAAVLGICAIVVVTAALWASADPDGLERVAEDLGFIESGEGPSYELLPDYTILGLDGPASTIVAGIIGIVIVLALMWGTGKLLARRSRTSA
jgi:cobalt/nickel transport system permease protein